MPRARFAVLVLLCFAHVAAAQELRYRIIDLGTHPNLNSSSARGLNNRGMAVTQLEPGPFEDKFNHAAVFNLGPIQLLPDTGDTDRDDAVGKDISDTGVVGGTYSESGSEARPAVWVDGVFKKPIMLGGGTRGSVDAISNEADWVAVGHTDTRVIGAPNQSRAVMWDKNLGIPLNLDTLATGTESVSSVAYDVNKNHQVVGVSGTDNGVLRPFLWEQATGMVDLGTLSEFARSQANGINDAKHVVGESNNRAFYWSDGVMTPVGGNNSTAQAINNSDVIVGNVLGRAGISLSPTDTMVQLQTLLTGDSTGWTLSTAMDINDRWQIVGSGADPSGRSRAYLALPIWLGANNSIPDGDSSFDSLGDLGGWTPSGPGSADVIADPSGANNFVMSLTTGSPIVVERTVDTPGSAFSVGFEFHFLTSFGALSVSLDGVEVASLAAPGDVTDVFTPYSVMIDRKDLMNLDDVPFTFGLEGPTGSQVLIDNITLAVGVPEPATGLLGLFAVGLLAVGWLRRR